MAINDIGSEHYTRDEVTRIIRRALDMKREGTVNREDLMQTAAELGLDPETVVTAIEEEKADQKRKAALEKRDRRRRAAFRRHLWSFIIVNAGLFLINSVTPGPWWFQWPLLGWGIGLAFNYRAAYYPTGHIAGDPHGN